MDKPGQISAKAQVERLSPGLKVGLFGGSFNPAHQGHLHLAQTACTRLGLDRVLWLVSPGNPLKEPSHNYAQRLASAQTITAGIRRQQVCQSEKFYDNRFTIDTVNGFGQRWPDVRLVWLMGADNLKSFHHWRDWQDIAARIPIAVIARPTDPVLARLSPFARRFASARLPASAAHGLAARAAPAWVYLSAPLDFTSSSAIRASKAMA